MPRAHWASKESRLLTKRSPSPIATSNMSTTGVVPVGLLQSDKMAERGTCGLRAKENMAQSSEPGMAKFFYNSEYKQNVAQFAQVLSGQNCAELGSCKSVPDDTILFICNNWLQDIQ